MSGDLGPTCLGGSGTSPPSTPSPYLSAACTRSAWSEDLGRKNAHTLQHLRGAGSTRLVLTGWLFRSVTSH